MKTIAIIYSEEHVLDALDKLLTEANFEVIPYFDPDDALRDMHHISPSLYLINYKNINMNGFELYKRLVEKKGHDDVRAVFISSHHEIENEAYEIGGLDFIHVPFEKKDIIKRISNFA